ncbi:uncharacterized protein LOC133846505 isoform X2 [Drosophila sulfurigaster albostrigata]|nr:uncharacterized protein LOC133846505 isoform X2 [Drosophila sulfurigaster albostrigata]
MDIVQPGCGHDESDLETTTLDKATFTKPNRIEKKDTLDNKTLPKPSFGKTTLDKFAVHNATVDKEILEKTILNKATLIKRTINRLDKEILAKLPMQEATLDKWKLFQPTLDKLNSYTSKKLNESDKSETDESKVMPKNGTKPVRPRPLPQPMSESIGILCYKCSSDHRGSCALTEQKSQYSEFNVMCKVTKKDSGCYTTLDRHTRIITRGCLSVMSQSMENYCRKENELCEICFNNLCNIEKAPEIPEDSERDESQSLRGSFVLWLICVSASLSLAFG